MNTHSPKHQQSLPQCDYTGPQTLVQIRSSFAQIGAPQGRQRDSHMFHCYICGISFGYIDQLHYHEKLHHDTLRCSDTSCRQVLPSKAAMQSHQRSTHTLLACADCGYTVNGSSGIPKHLIHAHCHVAPIMCICESCKLFFGSQIEWALHSAGCRAKPAAHIPVSKSVLYGSHKVEERSPLTKVHQQQQNIINFVQQILEDMKVLPRGISTSS